MIIALFTSLSALSQINAEQVTAIGRNVLSMEDYLLAIQYFNQAIKAKPYLAEPYYFRAVAKIELEDFKGAEEDSSKAIEIKKYFNEAYRLRGFARQRLGLDSLAIEDYNICLKENPNDKDFLFYKAIAETELGHYDSADSTLTRLIEANPNFYEGISARAYLRVQTGDTIGALEDIEETLRISKSQINPYLMKADLCIKRQDWPNAIDAMNEIIRQNPDNPDLYLNRAYLHYRNDDYYGAMSDYNSAIDLDPLNEAAIFNRGLLRYEVYELSLAASDFSKVLELDKTNFHALYNRALIYMNMEDYAHAEPDIKKIIQKFPRFYPAYYALAQCRHARGDEKGAINYMLTADEMIRKYVANPKKYPLDRPTIAMEANDIAKNKNKKTEDKSEEEEVMEKFNQLVTKSQIQDNTLSFNEKIKGKVQDRETVTEIEPMYSLTFHEPEKSLRVLSNFFRELTDLNNRNYISEKIYLITDNQLSDQYEVERVFQTAEKYSKVLENSANRAVDFLARAVSYTMLKNYDAAIEDFDRALELMPDFTVALMGKGFAMSQKYLMETKTGANGKTTEKKGRDNKDKMLNGEFHDREAAQIMETYDKVLEQNPSLVYALYNKGNLYYAVGDYQSAIDCYSRALEIDSEMGPAYYNRGICLLTSGRKQPAIDDFRKAGELGILQSYHIMKQMQL